nr:replicase [Prunus necrotic ringspot virus]
MDPESLSQLLVSTLQKQCADETSTVGKVFSERGVALVERSIPKAEGERLNISFALSAEQKSLLSRNFPGRDIHFAQRDSSSHSFAAAHRLLETDYIYKCFGTTEEPVIDLGGNFVSHIKQKRYNVHSCCPLLDDRDGARFTERLISLKTYLRTHKEERHEADYCECRFEECPRRADYVMAVHAVSDLPITDLCAALTKKGTKKMILSIMMDPNMLLRDVGEIPNFNVRWEIDRAEDIIRFDFIDAPCLGYQHKFSVLQQYLTTNAVIVGDKAAYRVERKSDFGGVFIVDITAVAGYRPGMVVGGTRSCAWSTLIRNKTVVHTVDGEDHWWYDVTRRSKILVDTKVLTKVLEASFRQFKPNVEPESMIQNIATMLSSSTNYTVINGVTLQAGESLPHGDYVAIATTIYVRTKRMYDSIRTNIDRLNETRIVSIRDETQGEVYGKLGNVLGNLFAPTTTTQTIAGPKGREDAYELHPKSWSDEVRNFFYCCVGRQGVGHTLLSDPNLFVPLEIVLQAKWTGGSVLTVKTLFDDVVKPEYDRVEEELQRVRDDRDKSEKLQKAILTVAKWIEAHPDGKLPKGLGEVAALVPDMVDLRESVVAVEPKAVVNKYASEIQEAITYYELEADISAKKLRSVGEHCNWSKKFISTIWAGDESRRVYIPHTDSWLGPPNVPKPEPTGQYERGMTADGYVLMAWSGSSGQKFDGPLQVDAVCRRELSRYPAIFFDKSCEFAANLRLLPALREALTVEAKFTRRLMDGVAGCGKTTKILNECRMCNDQPDLVLTSNRSSAMELREKLPGSQLLRSTRVRTSDSYLMNPKRPSSVRVIFDECFLQHAGCVYAAASLAGAEELVLFGDTKQIPFVSRIPHFRLKDHLVSADEKVMSNLTYRCPADATMALSKWFYRRNVKTANTTLRSMSVKPIVSVSQIDRDFDLYMTHTQAEKHTLIASGVVPRDKVFTTAEAQGKTESRAALVRLSRTSMSLFTGKDPLMGPCHSLVAMSRFKRQFVYFTVADTDSDDLIAKAIRDVSNSSDDTVSSYIHRDHKI